MSTVKNCNFSCTCNRDGCDRKHYIEDANDRVAFLTVKELYEKYFNQFQHNETDPELKTKYMISDDDMEKLMKL